MAPMNRNRNRDHKKAVRRRGKNSKTHKYLGGANETRIRKRLGGHKLETSVGRNRNVKSRKMGAGLYSKLRKDSNRRPSDSNELRTKKYIRDAVELGLSTGYLIPDENSESQVLRVSSEIVKFGRCVEEGSGSDQNTDGSVAGGQGQAGNRNGRKAGGKRLATKNGRTNIRKRGRSRTKSPKAQTGPKRRRKRSESRGKVKARSQKRKRIPEAKNEEPRTRKNENKNADNDGDDNDEDDEPDAENNGNKNSSDGNKKVPVAGRPGSIVPHSDNNSPTTAKKKDDDKEGSEDERSSDEGDEEDEECDNKEQPEESMAEEDNNEDNDEERKSSD